MAEDVAMQSKDVERKDSRVRKKKKSKLTRFRKFVKTRFIETWIFEAIVSISVLAYSAAIATDDILATWRNLTSRKEISKSAFYYCFVIFNFEAALKIFVYGLWKKNTEEESRSKTHVLKEKKLHQIQTIFNLMDSKDTGTINFVQFRAGLRALGLELRETDSKRLFETLDDGHGVEVEEFTELVKKAISLQPRSKSYFQDRWNLFDFVALLAQWASVITRFRMMAVTIQGYDPSVEVLMVGKLFALLKLIKILYWKESFLDWLMVLPHTAQSMRYVIFLISVIVLVYSELAMNLFGIDGSLNGKCVVSPDNAIALEYDEVYWNKTSTFGELEVPLRVCSTGDSVFGKSNNCEKPGFVCSCKPPASNLSDREYLIDHPGCMRNQVGYMGNVNDGSPSLPKYGYLGFSNIGTASLTTFTLMCESDYSDLLRYISDGYDSVTAWLFVFSLAILSRFVLFGLPKAVVTSSWIDIKRERQEVVRKKQLDEQDDKYIEEIKARALKEEEVVSSDSKKKHMREAIMRRLATNDPSQLNAEIRNVFNLFDDDGSGELEAQEIMAAFRRLGLEITIEEAQQMVEEADADGNGVVDCDEFVEMVKSYLVQNENEMEVEERQSVHEEVQEDDDVVVKQCLFGKIELRRKPLGPFRILLCNILHHPRHIDECGDPVDDKIILEADTRNIFIQFGPELGQWSLFASAGGVSLVELDEEGKERRVLIPAGSMIPDGMGTSKNSGRADLVAFVAKFEKKQDEHARRVKEVLTNSLARTSYLEIFVGACIVLNTCSMTLDYFSGNVDMSCSDPFRCPQNIVVMPKLMDDLLSMSNLIFNLIFTVEAAIKILALGFTRYITDTTNMIDVTLVVISDLSNFLQYVFNGLNISILRIIRFLRIIRLVNRFRRLRILFAKLTESFVSLGDVVFVSFWFLGVAAIMGMQIFPCRVRLRPEECSNDVKDEFGQCPLFPTDCDHNDNCPIFYHCSFNVRKNYNTFWRSLATTLVFITDSNWLDIMYAGMRHYKIPVGGVFFFLTLYCLFSYFILVLFTAILIENFDTTDFEKEQLQVSIFRVQAMRVLKEQQAKLIENRERRSEGKILGEEWDSDEEGEEENELRGKSGEDILDVLRHLEKDDPTKQREVPPVKIFGCLQPPANNNIRQIARSIRKNKWFDVLILCTIILSCIMLALDSPIEQNMVIKPQNVLKVEYALFTMFSLEFLVKVLDNGFYWEHPQAYLRSTWNVLDFTILLCSVLDFMGFANLAVIRVLRVIRPLRFFNKFASLQTLINSLVMSRKEILNVFLVWGITFIIFALVGTMLFAGNLYKCNDDAAGTRPVYHSIDCIASSPPTRSWYDGELQTSQCDQQTGKLLAPPITNRIQCSGSFLTSYTRGSLRSSFVFDGDHTEILLPRVWENPSSSFDHFGLALLALFQLISLENWSEIAFNAVDVVGIGFQPRHNESPIYFFYFGLFILIMVYFILQLLVAIFIDSVRMRSGMIMYSELQRNFMRFESRIGTMTETKLIPMPKKRWHRRLFVFVESLEFQYFIMFVIFLNVGFMASEGYAVQRSWTSALSSIDYVFIIIYSIEIVLKCVAYGFAFFQSSWNLFDLFIVLVSIAEQTLSRSVGIRALRLLRLVRVFRTVKIIRRVPKLYLLFQAISASLPGLFATCLVVSIFLFIYVCVGVQFFAQVKYGVSLDNYRNFKNSWTALTTLLQVITNSGFRGVLQDLMVQAPYCTSCKNCVQDNFGNWQDFSDCGNAIFGSIFLCIYFIFMKYVLLNLFISMLVESFFNFHVEMKFVLNSEHIESFRMAWNSLDVRHDGAMSITKLRALVEILHRMNNPLGSCLFCDEFKMRVARLELMEDAEPGREMSFRKTLRVLSLHVTGPKALPYRQMLIQEEKIARLTQMAIVSALTTSYGQRKLAHSLSSDRDASLSKLSQIKSISSHKQRLGASLNFTANGGRKKIRLDMSSEMLISYDESDAAEFEIPFPEIIEVIDKKALVGSPVVLCLKSGDELILEVDSDCRHQFIEVVRTFVSAFKEAQELSQEQTSKISGANISDMMVFRYLGGQAVKEMERLVYSVRSKIKKE